MTSLKRRFFNIYATDFSKTSVEDGKLIPNKVLKVLHRYLPSFSSYRESPGGGTESSRFLPPARHELTTTFARLSTPGVAIHQEMICWLFSWSAIDLVVHVADCDIPDLR